MNTIKSLDQAVSFPVESTYIPRGVLHSHGEESGYTQWIGGWIPVGGRVCMERRATCGDPCVLGSCSLTSCSAC